MQSKQEKARRRANSEGSIYQRADGTWEAKITLPDGKRKSFYARTQGELLRKLKEGRKRIDDGLPPAPEKLTVKTWLETWLRDSVAHAVRPRTAHRYSTIVTHHLIPRLGHIRLAKLQPADVERALREALEARQSPRSAHHHRAVLRTALNHAIGQGLISRNAASLSKPPHVPEGEHDAISPDKGQGDSKGGQGRRP